MFSSHNFQCLNFNMKKLKFWNPRWRPLVTSLCCCRYHVTILNWKYTEHLLHIPSYHVNCWILLKIEGVRWPSPPSNISKLGDNWKRSVFFWCRVPKRSLLILYYQIKINKQMPYEKQFKLAKTATKQFGFITRIIIWHGLRWCGLTLKGIRGRVNLTGCVS